MTEEQIANRVAAKLTGEFYVGQRVRFVYGDTGTIVSIPNHAMPSVGVLWDAGSKTGSGAVLSTYPKNLTPI